VAQDLQRSDVPLYHLDAIDFGRRMAVEKELEKTENVPQPNAVFDESCNFLIYATLLGIKVSYASFFPTFSLLWFVHFSIIRLYIIFLLLSYIRNDQSFCQRFCKAKMS
jgi:hypothetical protein